MLGGAEVSEMSGSRMKCREAKCNEDLKQNELTK